MEDDRRWGMLIDMPLSLLGLMRKVREGSSTVVSVCQRLEAVFQSLRAEESGLGTPSCRRSWS